MPWLPPAFPTPCARPLSLRPSCGRRAARYASPRLRRSVRCRPAAKDEALYQIGPFDGEPNAERRRDFATDDMCASRHLRLDERHRVVDHQVERPGKIRRHWVRLAETAPIDAQHAIVASQMGNPGAPRFMCLGEAMDQQN